MVKTVNNENFNSIINEKEVVVIKFGAPWCGPCKMYVPVLESIAQEMTEITIGDLDVDDSGETASKFEIMSLPTVVIFKNGKQVDSFTGFVPEEPFKDKIKKFL